MVSETVCMSKGVQARKSEQEKEDSLIQVDRTKQEGWAILASGNDFVKAESACSGEHDFASGEAGTLL